MKKHFKLIALASLLMFAASALFIFSKSPADDKPETIIVKMFRGDLFDKAAIEVMYGGDKTEINKYSLKDDLDKALLNTIQKLNSDGYKVISQTSYVPISGGGNVGISSHENEIWVMVRK